MPQRRVDFFSSGDPGPGQKTRTNRPGLPDGRADFLAPSIRLNWTGFEAFARDTVLKGQQPVGSSKLTGNLERARHYPADPEGGDEHQQDVHAWNCPRNLAGAPLL